MTTTDHARRPGAHFFRRLLAALTFAALTLTAGSGAAHAVTPAEPPHGLMIQVSSLSGAMTPTQLETVLQTIRANHRDPAQPGFINSVVLQDIADPVGHLFTTYLDVLKPFLPGGETPAFDVAYVGTVDLDWTGAGSKYIEGIESASFRAQNVSLSTTAAKAFAARYPSLRYGWYVTYEANLAGFWDGNIESAYATYLNQLAAGLNTVGSGRAFMWSPAFWTPYASEPSRALGSLQANIADIASKVKIPFVIDLQDFVGQSGGASTAVDAATWMTYLHDNWVSSTTTLQINAEQFTQSGTGGFTAGDPVEVPNREAYYAQRLLTLGPAWEIRFWWTRLYGPLPAALTPSSRTH
jgi:hypothetical protein